MTQKDFAKLLGKTETEVSRWLSGTHNLTLATICKISIALGEDVVTIYVGNKYQEAGYSALDNCDGDLTDKVEVSGEVDSSSAGSYTVTYKVVDSYKNESVVTRTVKVLNRSLILDLVGFFKLFKTGKTPT